MTSLDWCVEKIATDREAQRQVGPPEIDDKNEVFILINVTIVWKPIAGTVVKSICQSSTVEFCDYLAGLLNVALESCYSHYVNPRGHVIEVLGHNN
jgi:hypothetical protein